MLGTNPPYATRLQEVPHTWLQAAVKMVAQRGPHSRFCLYNLGMYLSRCSDYHLLSSLVWPWSSPGTLSLTKLPSPPAHACPARARVTAHKGLIVGDHKVLDEHRKHRSALGREWPLGPRSSGARRWGWLGGWTGHGMALQATPRCPAPGWTEVRAGSSAR